jgi:hypothetical protein
MSTADEALIRGKAVTFNFSNNQEHTRALLFLSKILAACSGQMLQNKD